MKTMLILALLGAAAGGAGAVEEAARVEKPFVSAMFGNHMVLQRGHPIPVWGWAPPGSHVHVKLDDESASATAGADGKWMARLDPLPAGGPYTLAVSGPRAATLHDVLIGDVWFCSGQSNMEFGITGVTNAAHEIAAAHHPRLRLFTVPKVVETEPQETAGGEWTVCTPETVAAHGWGGFSAVAYFFGRDLQQSLNVPIGLVHSSWGGTPAEAWTSAAALAKLPDFRRPLEQLAQSRADQKAGNTFAVQTANWYAANDPGSAPSPRLGVPAWAVAPLDADWKTMRLPTHWEEAGLPDFDGVVWFRTTVVLPESAAGKPATLHLGPIDDRDTTWVNGVRVGATDTFEALRNYTIPAGTLKAGVNEIAVRVLDTGGGGGMYGAADSMALNVEDGPRVPLAGDWRYRVGVALAAAHTVPPSNNGNPNLPTVLYNAMVAPVAPFAIKGAIWYQGESNAGRAHQYRALLPAMITDWRKAWGEGDFPFLIVQLANYTPVLPQPAESDWAELREAQWLTTKTLKNTGIATAIDVGEAADIHPKNKQEVGRRLALAALQMAYHQKVAASGPTYRAMKTEGNAIRITFDHADGMKPRDGETLKGFAIAGTDHHFVWADAKIEGNAILVSSPAVPAPAAVRYAWATNPDANLINAAGLPALPFRTDTWPGVTDNAK